VIGTAAMLWVGGSIIEHGLHEFHIDEPGHTIKVLADSAAAMVTQGAGAVQWLVTAALDGVFGLIVGVLLIPVATRVLGPVIAALTGKKARGH
jgi:predicted DNA repair protein MutK